MPEHGTNGRYTNHGCHCDPCKAAHASEARKYRSTPSSAAARRREGARYRAGKQAEREKLEAAHKARVLALQAMADALHKPKPKAKATRKVKVRQGMTWSWQEVEV